MTENQTPGPAPRNDGPDRQDPWEQHAADHGRDAAAGVRQAGDPGADESGPRQYPTGQYPTERLDQEGNNPTQELPGAPRPVYPQRQPFDGRAAGQQWSEHQAPGNDQAPQPGYGYFNQGNQYAGQNQSANAMHAANGTQGPHGAGYAPNPKDAPRRKASFGVGTLVASILAAGLVGGSVATVGSAEWFGNSGSGAAVSSNSQPGTVIVNDQEDVNAITAAAVKASPSVVTISAAAGGSGGTGSGIILDDQGHILTNTHVVTLDGQTADAALEVRTSDGKVLTAKLVGTDPLSDLAVIKVDNASGLTPATLGDSGKLNVGDTAIAIGSPLGLTGTVTDGIVSTLNRTISVASAAAPEEGDNAEGDDEGGFQFAPPGGGQSQQTGQGEISINVIQTDAAINPGNSGGALVNSSGEVIGVNVAIASAGSSASSTSGNIGVGFSIPINHAKRVAQEIIETGKASHGQLGVSVKKKTASSAPSGFSVGAEVATVEPDSAAGKAGIKVGDVITKFNDLPIGEPEQLTAAVREQRAGSNVKITVLRSGKEQTFDVSLGAAAS